MNFKDIKKGVINFFKGWFKPSGTATRKEYLVGIIIYFILIFMMYVKFKSNLVILFVCAVILFFPYYSLASRRLHDVGYEKVFGVILGASVINPLILIIPCLLMLPKDKRNANSGEKKD